MRLHTILSTLLSSIFFSNVLAMGDIQKSVFLPQVFTVTAGPTWDSSGKIQTFFLQPDIEKTYYAFKRSKILASGELFLGWQRLLNPTFIGQLGLAIAGSGNTTLLGDIWEDADPDFDNFTYTYRVNHAHVAVRGKLLANIMDFLQLKVTPYVTGSIGVGFNQAHDFMITPKICEEVPAPLFQDHSTTTFTYTLGAGLQRTLTPHLQVGAGYEFADWGKSHLSHAVGQTLNEGLRLNHLYNHQLEFSVTYTA